MEQKNNKEKKKELKHQGQFILICLFYFNLFILICLFRFHKKPPQQKSPGFLWCFEKLAMMASTRRLFVMTCDWPITIGKNTATDLCKNNYDNATEVSIL